MEERDVGVFYVPGFVCVCVYVCANWRKDWHTLSQCQQVPKRKGKWKKNIARQCTAHRETILLLSFFFLFFFCCRSWSNISPQIRFRFCTNWRSFSEFHSLNPFDSLILTVSSLNPSLETWAYPSMHWAEGKKTSWPCKPVQNLSYTGYLDFAEALMMSYSDFPFSSAPHPSEQS